MKLLAFVILCALSLWGCDQDPSFQATEDGTLNGTKGNRDLDAKGTQKDDLKDGEDPSDIKDKPLPDLGNKGKPGGPNGPDNPSNNNNNNNNNNGSLQLVSKVFATSDTLETQAVAQLSTQQTSQELKQLREYLDTVKKMKQIKRPDIDDITKQGNLGTFASESFQQVTNNALDILIVIDNSGSMNQEQVNLASKLNPLLSYIAPSDWAIAVTTTDPSDGCLRSYIKKGDADIETKFNNAIQAGTSGSGIERGVLQAVDSLIGACLSQPWLRINSALAILIVSDEDNCSAGNHCNNAAYQSGDYLMSHLTSIREPGTNAKVYGIFWHPDTPSSQCSTAYNKATIYAQLVDDTNGKWGSICDNDYSATLVDMSQNISAVLMKNFTLKDLPNPATVQVYIDGALLANTEYSITNKVVSLNSPPGAGSTVRIDYYHSGTEITDTFKLSKTPYNNEVAVAVDGIATPATDYTFDSVKKEVVFNSTPAADAMVKISYQEDIVMPTKFRVSGDVKSGSMVVKVGGVATTDYSYNEPTKEVIFTTGPDAAADIEISYIEIGAPILAYPFMVNGHEAMGLTVKDKASGNPIPNTDYSYTGGVLTFVAGAWTEDRVVILIYNDDTGNNNLIELAYVPMAGTLSATDGSINCVEADLIVSGKTVDYSGCGFPQTSMTITVDFSYVSVRYTEFEFPKDGLPADLNDVNWTVLVDAAATNDYTRNDNIFTFSSSPASLEIKAEFE